MVIEVFGRFWFVVEASGVKSESPARISEAPDFGSAFGGVGFRYPGAGTGPRPCVSVPALGYRNRGWCTGTPLEVPVPSARNHPDSAGSVYFGEGTVDFSFPSANPLPLLVK